MLWWLKPLSQHREVTMGMVIREVCPRCQSAAFKIAPFGRAFKHQSLYQGPDRCALDRYRWKQHHGIECFWKMMKSIFQLRAMHLQGDGLYTALLIKVIAYLLALRLQAEGVF